MRVLKIKVICGEETCFSMEDRKMCCYMGFRRFGTVPVCMLFPNDGISYTDLSESESGFALRCQKCIDIEKLQSPSNPSE